MRSSTWSSEPRSTSPRKYPVNTIDGVRITFPKGWGLLRASNTQPVLVMRFEATDPQSRDDYQAEVDGWLEKQKSASEAEQHGSRLRCPDAVGGSPPRLGRCLPSSLWDAGPPLSWPTAGGPPELSPAAAKFLTDWHLLQLTLDLTGCLIASAWFIGHLLLVYRAVGTVQVRRNVANLEFREALTPRALLTVVVVTGALLGLLVGTGAPAGGARSPSPGRA